MTLISLNAPHCCACSVVCHHIGPPRWCEAHLPPIRERLTRLDINVRSTA